MLSDQTQPTYDASPPQQPRRWPAFLAAVCFIALAAVAAAQYMRIADLNDNLSASRREIAEVRESQVAASARAEKNLSELERLIATGQKDTSSAVAKIQASTQTVAKRHADAVAKQLAGELAKQKSETEMVNSEIAKIRESATVESTKLTDVSSQVGVVKTDLASARTDIEKTLADLQRARGDMGVMSGLIATNSNEIQALRELGDRNIYEFTLTKAAGLQRVGDIQMELRKADVKRNRYTVNVFSEDRKTEKKEKTINEPVQFYVASKARQPYEIVVNQVDKNTIKGYLSTPKVTLTRIP